MGRVITETPGRASQILGPVFQTLGRAFETLS